MDITASIVSHGHGTQVLALLGDLARLAARGQPHPRRAIVTLNVPEPQLAAALAAGVWPFELQVRANPAPLGFGANHNRAFQLDGEGGGSSLFAVLNPDLHLAANPFSALCAALDADPQAGLAYPLQVDAQGRRQDHERRWPTPARLLARHLLRRRHEVSGGQAPDWVNAAFLLLRRPAFAAVGGFDEGFHMYSEHVDLCLRLRQAGWRLARADGAVVEHVAQRASRRQPRHLLWHVRSLLRLWRSPAWRARPVRESSFRDSTDHP